MTHSRRSKSDSNVATCVVCQLIMDEWGLQPRFRSTSLFIGLKMPDLPSQTPPRAQSGIGAHKQPIEGDPDRSTSARPFAEPQNLNVGSISFGAPSMAAGNERGRPGGCPRRISRRKFKATRQLCRVGPRNIGNVNMNTRYTVALSMLAGAALGGAAIQGLHSQAKPPVYTVSEIQITNLPVPVGFSSLGSDQTAMKAGKLDRAELVGNAGPFLHH